MVKSIHNRKRKAVKAVAHKARVGRSAYVMKPESLALIENFRLKGGEDVERRACRGGHP